MFSLWFDLTFYFTLCEEFFVSRAMKFVVNETKLQSGVQFESTIGGGFQWKDTARRYNIVSLAYEHKFIYFLLISRKRRTQETRGAAAESMGRREDRVSSRGLIDICSGVEHRARASQRERTDGRPVCVCDNIIRHALLYKCRCGVCRVSVYTATQSGILFAPFRITKKSGAAATKLLLLDFLGNVYTWPY